MKRLHQQELVMQGLKESTSLTVAYDNMGEPFREGIMLRFEDEDEHIRVLLDEADARKLRDLLNQLLNEDPL